MAANLRQFFERKKKIAVFYEYNAYLIKVKKPFAVFVSVEAPKL